MLVDYYTISGSTKGRGFSQSTPPPEIENFKVPPLSFENLYDPLPFQTILLEILRMLTSKIIHNFWDMTQNSRGYVWALPLHLPITGYTVIYQLIDQIYRFF